MPCFLQDCNSRRPRTADRRNIGLEECQSGEPVYRAPGPRGRSRRAGRRRLCRRRTGRARISKSSSGPGSSGSTRAASVLRRWSRPGSLRWIPRPTSAAQDRVQAGALRSGTGKARSTARGREGSPPCRMRSRAAPPRTMIFIDCYPAGNRVRRPLQESCDDGQRIVFKP